MVKSKKTPTNNLKITRRFGSRTGALFTNEATKERGLTMYVQIDGANSVRKQKEECRHCDLE